MYRVIVTGGAGYVGSHVCKQLRAEGFLPVTIDNLATGWQHAVQFGPFELVDITRLSELKVVFAKWNPIAVIHLAARTSVGESVEQPEEYHLCNVEGTRNVISAMLDQDCCQFIFSSTCAVYGNSPVGRVNEASPLNPISPYAENKRESEKLLATFARENGVRSTIFRYFNVAGSDPENHIGEWKASPSNLIPAVLECAAHGRPFEIFGTDYPTPDGTCIRDYVHANDVANAHIQGMKTMLNGNSGDLYNIGTGTGNSVREVVDCCRKITGINFPINEASRRDGDVARVVGDCAKAQSKLGWSAQRSTIEEMISDAWNWRCKGGYGRIG